MERRVSPLNIDGPRFSQGFFGNPIRKIKQLQEPPHTAYHGPLNPTTRSIQLFSQIFGSSLHERKANSISFEWAPVPKSIRAISGPIPFPMSRAE